jgi:hypothetical protein
VTESDPEPNPYEPPNVPTADERIQSPRWQRALALAVPTVAGASIMCGVWVLESSNLIMAPVFFGLAACSSLRPIRFSPSVPAENLNMTSPPASHNNYCAS